MKIELTEDVFEIDRNGAEAGLKVTIRKRLKQVDAIIDGKPRKALIPDNLVIPWTKGTIIDVSDATAAKLIDRGQAKESKDDSSDSLEAASTDSSAV